MYIWKGTFRLDTWDFTRSGRLGLVAARGLVDFIRRNTTSGRKVLATVDLPPLDPTDPLTRTLLDKIQRIMNEGTRIKSRLGSTGFPHKRYQIECKHGGSVVDGNASLCWTFRRSLLLFLTPPAFSIPPQRGS